MRPPRLRQQSTRNLDRCCPCLFAAMLQKLEEMQLKDTLRMFNGLVERCFSECVVSFRSKALTATEEKCVSTCAEKYMKHSVRRMKHRMRRMHRCTCTPAAHHTPRAPRTPRTRTSHRPCTARVEFTPLHVVRHAGPGRPALRRVHCGGAGGAAGGGG